MLEARIAPAGLVTASLVGGKLTLTGDLDANVLTITVPAPGSITITGAGTMIAFNGAAPAANVTTALPFAELAAALGAGSDFLTLTGLALGKGVKFDGGAGNDRLDVNDTVIDGALTFLGGADDDHFNTGGARFHAGKVLVDLGVGNNDLGPAATNSTVAGDFTVKAGAGDDGFFITSPQFRVGGSLSFNGGGGNDSVSIASTYVGVDRSLIITLGAHTVQLANNINTPTLSVGGDLLITTGSGAETDFTFTNNTDLAIGGKTVLKGGDSIDKFNFTYARGTFLGGVTAALGGDTNTLNFTASAATFFGSLKYSGGGGADTLSFTTSPDVTVAGAIDAKLGDGTNDVQLAPSSRLTVGGGVKIGAGTGNETINLGSATLEVRKGIALAVGAGNATVNVTGSSSGHVSGAISFAGGTATTDTENISLTFGNALFTGGVSLKSGGGAFTNNVTVSGTLAITGDYRVAAVGEGVKAINFSSAQLRLGGALDLKGGSDGSNFNLAPGPYVIGKVKLQGGAGTDVFKLIGDGQVAGLVDVQLGGGGNQIDVTGNNGTVLSGGLKILSTSAAGENEVVNLTSVILPGALNIKLAAGFGTVKLDDITAAGAVTIDTGAGIDTVTFESVNAGTKSVYRGPVKILLGTGADTVNLGLAAMANALVELQAPMFIDGGGDADFDAINQNNVTLVGAGSITPVNFP